VGLHHWTRHPDKIGLFGVGDMMKIMSAQKCWNELSMLSMAHQRDTRVTYRKTILRQIKLPTYKKAGTYLPPPSNTNEAFIASFSRAIRLATASVSILRRP
jgi:hypothetical protein